MTEIKNMSSFFKKREEEGFLEPKTSKHLILNEDIDNYNEGLAVLGFDKLGKGYSVNYDMETFEPYNKKELEKKGFYSDLEKINAEKNGGLSLDFLEKRFEEGLKKYASEKSINLKTISSSEMVDTVKSFVTKTGMEHRQDPEVNLKKFVSFGLPAKETESPPKSNVSKLKMRF